MSDKIVNVYKVIQSLDGKWEVVGPSATVYASTMLKAQIYAFVMNQAYTAGLEAHGSSG